MTEVEVTTRGWLTATLEILDADALDKIDRSRTFPVVDCGPSTQPNRQATVLKVKPNESHRPKVCQL